MTLLHTARIRLEPMTTAHLDGLHAMNALPEVMRHISGAPETREQTQDWIAMIERLWAAWGMGWWTWVEPASNRVMGAGCVRYARKQVDYPADLQTLRVNPLEIGWRLHPDFWGQGLALEGARRMIDFAFQDLAAPELIATRHADNSASERLMERLGMRYRGLEPWYGEPSPTHAISRQEWLQNRAPKPH